MNNLERKVRDLEDFAQRVEHLGIDVIQAHPINMEDRAIADYVTNPQELNLEYMRDEDIAWEEYSWGILDPELRKRQREVLRDYERWYSAAFQLIQHYLPERSNDFSKYYESQKGKQPVEKVLAELTNV